MWNLNQLKEYSTLSKATIYRLIAAGRLPAAIKISERRVAWDADAVKAALLQKTAQ